MATELPYHCQLSKIGRSQGRSSTAAAAYRSGQRIVDESTGEIHDYTRKRGVEDSLIVLPQGGTMDRSALWNKVEKHHKRGDAVVAREIEVALPRTLNAEQRRRLVQSYAAKLADRYGVAVDACIHEPHAVTDADLIANPDQFFVTEADGRRHNGNWHCHILMSACHCDAEGVLGKKVVELDEMHCYRAGIPNAAQEQRPAWAAAVNEALVEADQGEYFVDHRSFEERGITDRVPTEHRGPAVTAILRRGGQSHVADAQATSQLSRLARAVEAAGEAVEAIQAELASVAREAAAVAAAAVAAVAPLPAAAVEPASVAVGHQVEAPQAPQRTAAPADPRPARAAEAPQTPKGQGQDQPSARAQAPAPRGADPAPSPVAPRVVKTAQSDHRPSQAEPPQQAQRAHEEAMRRLADQFSAERAAARRRGPEQVRQERQEAARAALLRVREAAARLKAAEGAEARAGAALREARERRNRHWDPDEAAKAEAVAKDKAARLAQEYRALEARIEARGMLAKLAARVSDPEAERLEALWPKVQAAAQAATEAGTRAMDARGASNAAVRASYALRDASQEHQAALRDARTALDAAKPYQAEIDAIKRQEAAEREAARLEAERQAQLDADQAERDDGWDYEA